MNFWLAIALIVVAAVLSGGIFAFVGFKLGEKYRRKVGEEKIGSAEQEAKRIVEEAQREAEATKKEAVISGKDEAHKLLSNAEKEISERRKEIQRQERRIQQKEETVEKKMDGLEKKEEAVSQKNKAAEARLEEAEKLKQSQFEMLEKISGLTAEQAKSYILTSLDGELAHEKAVRIKEYEQKTKKKNPKRPQERSFLLLFRGSLQTM